MSEAPRRLAPVLAALLCGLLAVTSAMKQERQEGRQCGNGPVPGLCPGRPVHVLEAQIGHCARPGSCCSGRDRDITCTVPAAHFSQAVMGQVDVNYNMGNLAPSWKCRASYGRECPACYNVFKYSFQCVDNASRIEMGSGNTRRMKQGYISSPDYLAAASSHSPGHLTREAPTIPDGCTCRVKVKKSKKKFTATLLTSVLEGGASLTLTSDKGRQVVQGNRTYLASAHDSQNTDLVFSGLKSLELSFSKASRARFLLYIKGKGDLDFECDAPETIHPSRPVHRPTWPTYPTYPTYPRPHPTDPPTGHPSTTAVTRGLLSRPTSMSPADTTPHVVMDPSPDAHLSSTEAAAIGAAVGVSLVAVLVLVVACLAVARYRRAKAAGVDGAGEFVPPSLPVGGHSDHEYVSIPDAKVNNSATNAGYSSVKDVFSHITRGPRAPTVRHETVYEDIRELPSAPPYTDNGPLSARSSHKYAEYDEVYSQPSKLKKQMENDDVFRPGLESSNEVVKGAEQAGSKNDPQVSPDTLEYERIDGGCALEYEAIPSAAGDCEYADLDSVAGEDEQGGVAEGAVAGRPGGNLPPGMEVKQNSMYDDDE